MTQVTRILSEIEQGDQGAAEELLPLVYDELRKLAAAKLANEKPGQTLQATALVHEAYMRLVDVEKAQHWNSRGHFFGAVAEAMRRLLVESARKKHRLKRGGDLERLTLEESDAVVLETSLDLMALHEALTKLERKAPKKAELVKLRYFCGFSLEEASNLLGVSSATAKRYWSYARAWLFAEITEPADSENSQNSQN